MKKPLTPLLLLLALGAALLFAAPGGAVTAHAARTSTVKLKDDFFAVKHKKLSIGTGTKVRFVWAGYNPHDVHVRGARSHSRLRTTGSYAFTFKKRGTYHVFCSIHAYLGMTMTVVVR